MPAQIGDLKLPRVSPHFLRCRRAVRPYRSSGSVVIGLSGGADSLALLAAALAEGVNADVVVIDHQLQTGSEKVSARAVDMAWHMGASAQLRTVLVSQTGSMEAAARQARYGALHEIADGREVWVAHTRDDQAETFLLGALRGNPTGMSVRAGQLIRPFLAVRRQDTLGACAELGLEPWHDPQNFDLAFRRVAMRRHVLPLLSEILGGDSADPIAQAADRIAADSALLDELAGPPTDDCAELAAQPAPLRRRRIAAWLQDKELRVTGASISAIEALCTDWRGQGGVAVGGFAGARLAVWRTGGKLAISTQFEES